MMYQRSKKRPKSSRFSTLAYQNLESRRLLAIDLSGTIVEDTILDDAQGYRIVGNITVDPGVSLTIAPNINVIDNGEEHTLLVQGTLSIDQSQLLAPGLSLGFPSTVETSFVANSAEVRLRNLIHPETNQQSAGSHQTTLTNSKLTLDGELKGFGDLTIESSELALKTWNGNGAVSVTNSNVILDSINSAGKLRVESSSFTIQSDSNINGEFSSSIIQANQSLGGDFTLADQSEMAVIGKLEANIESMNSTIIAGSSVEPSYPGDFSLVDSSLSVSETFTVDSFIAINSTVSAEGRIVLGDSPGHVEIMTSTIESAEDIVLVNVENLSNNEIMSNDVFIHTQKLSDEEKSGNSFLLSEGSTGNLEVAANDYIPNWPDTTFDGRIKFALVSGVHDDVTITPHPSVVHISISNGKAGETTYPPRVRLTGSITFVDVEVEVFGGYLDYYPSGEPSGSFPRHALTAFPGSSITVKNSTLYGRLDERTPPLLSFDAEGAELTVQGSTFRDLSIFTDSRSSESPFLMTIDQSRFYDSSIFLQNNLTASISDSFFTKSVSPHYVFNYAIRQDIQENAFDNHISELTMDSNLFIDTAISLGGLNSRKGPSWTLTNNTFAGGLSVNRLIGENVSATGNHFLNGVEYVGSDNIDLSRNAWGTVDPSRIEEMIWHSNDDTSLGTVTYLPAIDDPAVGSILPDHFEVELTQDMLIVSRNGDAPTIWQLADLDELTLEGGDGGPDTIRVTLSEWDESVESMLEQTTLTHPELALTLTGFEDLTFVSQGSDSISLVADSDSANSFHFQDGTATLRSRDVIRRSQDINQIAVRSLSETPNIAATLLGSDSADQLTVDTTSEFMTHGSLIRISGFSELIARVGEGRDRVSIHDTELDDTLIVNSSGVFLTNQNGLVFSGIGFENIDAESATGVDRAYLDDTADDDQFFAMPTTTRFVTPNGEVRTDGFAETIARVLNGGDDSAHFQDSAGNDHANLTPGYASIENGASISKAIGFTFVTATAGQGFDTAHFLDSDGDDNLIMLHNRTTLSGDGFEFHAMNFENVFANASTGNDVATFYDSVGDDQFIAKPQFGLMLGSNYQNFALGFDRNLAFSINGGIDISRLRDSEGDDTLYSHARRTTLQGDGFQSFVSGFDRTLTFASNGGRDEAFATDSIGDDLLGGTGDELWLAGEGKFRLISGFHLVNAYSDQGGFDRNLTFDLGFELNVQGNWN